MDIFRYFGLLTAVQVNTPTTAAVVCMYDVYSICNPAARGSHLRRGRGLSYQCHPVITQAARLAVPEKDTSTRKSTRERDD